MNPNRSEHWNADFRAAVQGLLASGKWYDARKPEIISTAALIADMMDAQRAGLVEPTTEAP